MTARVAPCGRRTRPVGRLLFSPRTHAHGREKKIEGRRGEAPPHRAPLTVTGSTAVKSPLVPYVRVKKNSPSHTHTEARAGSFSAWFVRSLRPGNAGPDSVVQRLRTKNPGWRAGEKVKAAPHPGTVPVADAPDGRAGAGAGLEKRRKPGAMGM